MKQGVQLGSNRNKQIRVTWPQVTPQKRGVGVARTLPYSLQRLGFVPSVVTARLFPGRRRAGGVQGVPAVGAQRGEHRVLAPLRGVQANQAALAAAPQGHGGLRGVHLGPGGPGGGCSQQSGGGSSLGVASALGPADPKRRSRGLTCYQLDIPRGSAEQGPLSDGSGCSDGPPSTWAREDPPCSHVRGVGVGGQVCPPPSRCSANRPPLPLRSTWTRAPGSRPAGTCWRPPPPALTKPRGRSST